MGGPLTPICTQVTPYQSEPEFRAAWGPRPEFADLAAPGVDVRELQFAAPVGDIDVYAAEVAEEES